MLELALFGNCADRHKQQRLKRASYLWSKFFFSHINKIKKKINK